MHSFRGPRRYRLEHAFQGRRRVFGDGAELTEKHDCRRPALLVGVCSFLAQVSLAGSVSHEALFTHTNAPVVPRFDPALGWLQSMVVEIVECGETDIWRLDNDNGVAVEAHCSRSHRVTVAMPGGEGAWRGIGEFRLELSLSATLQANDGDGAGSMNGGSDEVQATVVGAPTSPFVITKQEHMSYSIGTGLVSYSVSVFGANTEVTDGVEYESTFVGRSGRLRVTYHYDPPGSNMWEHVHRSNAVSSVMHDGEKFVAFTYSGGREVLTSGDGSNWLSSGPLPQGCIGLTHDGSARWYSIVLRSENVSWGKMYILELHSSTNGSSWAEHAELYRGSVFRPVGGEICAGAGVVLIRQRNTWGQGSGVGWPPPYVYVYNVASNSWTRKDEMTVFQSFRFVDGAFWAMRSDGVIVCSSYAGTTWTPICSTGMTMPVPGLSAIYGGRLVVPSHPSIRRMYVFNSLDDMKEVLLPCQPGSFAYNGRHVVMLSGGAIYCSKDQMKSWKVYLEPGLSAKSVACDDERFVVIAAGESSTVILNMASARSELSQLSGSPLSAELCKASETDFTGYTRVVDVLRLLPDSGTADWVQIETSRDLVDWQPFGLPTPGAATVDFRITDFPTNRAFFRATAVDL